MHLKTIYKFDKKGIYILLDIFIISALLIKLVSLLLFLAPGLVGRL